MEKQVEAVRKANWKDFWLHLNPFHKEYKRAAIISYKDLKEQVEMLQEALLNIEKLNLDLRAQRHDFLNHIQILYSLMELEEYDETLKYLNEIYGDIGKLNANIKTDLVAVNALLQAKSSEANRKSMILHVETRTKLSQMGMHEWTLCRCLGNLIDNAFEAVEKLTDQRFHTIELTLKETIQYYEITIRNTAPMMRPERLFEILEPGVTSKPNAVGHGMGLAIVKEHVEEEGGALLISFMEDPAIYKNTDYGWFVVGLKIPKK